MIDIDIDRYRSSELNQHQIISNTSSDGNGDGGGIISSIKEEEEIPWLVEIKKVFYFGRIENYDDFEP